MTILHHELNEIIDGKLLTPHFQPIISLDQKKVMGYEALIRGPSGSSLHNPVDLFNTAERFNLTTKLESLCREITVEHYACLNNNEKLFINVSPSVLLQPDLKNEVMLKLFNQFRIHPRSVIIELKEHKPIHNYSLMREATMQCRKMGFEIAIDDLGSGYSGLRLWSELLPEYVKIDSHFIEDLNNDPVKLSFVRSIQTIATSLKCFLIAEGIETKDELKAVEKLGIVYAQGYYFGEPTAIPLKEIDKSLFIAGHTADCHPNPFQPTTALHITKNIPSVSSETDISDVMRLFQQDSELTTLAMVDDNHASGIIFRDRFLSKLFSSRYGIELYGKKPIKTFIDKMPLSVDQKTSIQSVSQMLTSSMRSDPAFVITHNGEYAGIATILDLLEEMTRQQIHHAKHANPLTLLPGSVPINEYVNQLLANKTPFSFGYFDLDNFKPFNDVYGYSAGDDIIKAVASTLIQHVAAEKGLVGHIGGDDFIVIFTGDNWLECCINILETFKNLVPSYYKDADIAAGGIYSENRLGEKSFFPLISLSIGLVAAASTRQCHSHVDLADLASESKKQAKKIEGNSFFINQRIEVKG
ncbi:MAG: EAL domain-containing protein [Methylococcaceae bacterium]